MSNERKRLPGSEKLTRPEDINALSKYLGDIRKTQEEHTVLDKDNLEVPGRTTGRIPDIQELPDGKDLLDVNGEQSLSETRLDLDTNQDIELENYLDTINADNDISLDDRKIDLEDNRELPLDTRRDDLEVSNEAELDNTVLGLETPEEDSHLDETRLNLEINEELSLDTNRIGLEGEIEDASLSEYREDLKGVISDPTLSETKLNLEDVNLDNNLGETRLDLEVSDEPELKNARLNLEVDTENINLSEYQEKLDDITSDQILEETRLDLEDVNLDNNLGETRLDLEADQNTDLSDTRIGLETSQDSNLENTRLDLEADQDTDLSSTRLDLEASKDSNLENARLDLEAGQDTELNDTRLDLEASQDPNLENARLDLEVSQDTDLSSTRLDLDNNSEVKKLSDTILNLEDKSTPELSDEVIDLKVDTKSELDDTRIELSTDGDTNLDKTRVDIEDDNKPELDDTKLELTNVNDTPLSDTKIERGGEEKEVSLNDYLDSLDDDRENTLEDKRLDIDGKEVSGLYDSVISGPEAVDVELGDTRLNISSEGIENLEDTKIEIEEVEEVDSLYDSVISTPQNPDHESWSKKQLYDSIMMAPDDQKYEKALEMASTMGPWGMKVASLISSVLSNDSVDSDTASWFDKELKNLLKQMGAMSDFGIDSYLNSNERAQRLKSQEKEKYRTNIANSENEQNYYDSEYLSQEFGGNIERPSSPIENKAASLDKDIKEGIKSKEEILKDYQLQDGLSSKDGKVLRPKEESSTLIRREDGVEMTTVEAVMADYGKPTQSLFGEIKSSGRGYQTIPKYKLPSRGILDALNISNYLRFGVEELFGLWNPKTMIERKLKPILINEALALLVIAREQLEKLTKGNRERLPGDGMGLIGDLVSGGVSGALGNLKDNAMSALQNTFAGVDGVDKTNPLNRPRTKLGIGGWVPEVTKGFDKGNVRQDPPSDGSMDWKQLGKNLGKNLVNALIGGLADMNKTRDLDFAHKDGDQAGEAKVKPGHGLGYINNPAMIMTLEDLCELANPETQLDSLEALKEVLKNSPYITTPAQFGTIEEGRYKSMTLDTNSYWEVVIEPFCHTSMNGGYSFLPAIEEINVINQAHFGVKTSYSKWLPIINFELQKSKLTNKSLGLYDGEIVYPVTSELSNELRMTIVDDQYKSWRTYFQKCSDVSVYSSEAHAITYYADTNWNNQSDALGNLATAISDKKKRGKHITVVDKTRPLVALYKNITFLIKIYIMTPQYATIKRFNLLCVLKDFEESYSGDIDAGGYDLNLSFSIVGENPPPDRAGVYVKKENKKSLSEILGGRDPEKLNQPPKKKGGIIKLL